MPRHHWGPPPPPPPHGPHHAPPPPPGHWAPGPEVQALANRLRPYLGEDEANWAAEIIAYDPGPGRLHARLLLVLLERVDVLLNRLDGGRQLQTTGQEAD